MINEMEKETGIVNARHNTIQEKRSRKKLG